MKEYGNEREMGLEKEADERKVIYAKGTTVREREREKRTSRRETGEI